MLHHVELSFQTYTTVYVPGNGSSVNNLITRSINLGQKDGAIDTVKHISCSFKRKRLTLRHRITEKRLVSTTWHFMRLPSHN